MDNSSAAVGDNSTRLSTELSEPGFAALYVAILLIEVVAVALAVLATCSLCCNLAIPRGIVAFLISQLAFSILIAFCTGSFYLLALILSLSSLETPPELFCQFLLWGYGFAAVGKMWSLMAFSFVALLITKYGIKVFKRVHIVLGVVGVWVGAFIFNIYIILPSPVYAVQYVDNVACFPNNTATPPATRIPTLTVWLLFGGMIPIIASIIIPIITLCYIKRNTITKDAEYSKKIARFAFFLAASNMGDIIDFLGGTLQGLIVMYSQTSGVIFAYVLVAISLLPTPIVIIVFMKPVQEQLRKMFCFACNYRSQTYLMSKAKPSAGGDKSIHMTLLQK
jgi:hypothetical protein